MSDFTCAGCGKTFTKAWTDEEAYAEAAEVFGEIPEETRLEVCDSCYASIIDTAAERGVQHLERDHEAARRAADRARG